MDRRMWVAILAKLVSPMDPERAAAGLAAMLPMLAGYPDAMFCQDSAHAICTTGRVLSQGVYGPMTRVPTYGEVQDALGRWWRNKGEFVPVPPSAGFLPAPEAEERTPEAIEQVRALVAGFAAERSFNNPMSKDDPRMVARRTSNINELRRWEDAERKGLAGAASRVRILRERLKPPPVKARDMFQE